MKKNSDKVFIEPKISTFTQYIDLIFKHKASQDIGFIYLVKYNDKRNKNLPKKIYKFYNSIVKTYEDGDIAYLPNSTNKTCLVFYGRDKYKNLTIELGSIISSKIISMNWLVKNKTKLKNEDYFYLGWGLEQYKFNNYKNLKSILLSNNVKNTITSSILSGIYYGKELINIPSSDMGPEALERSFIDFADYHKAKYNIIKNLEIKNFFPLIHAVGKGSIEEPRLLEFNWGKAADPLVILVGKGVCFDTGGLDLKPSQFMRNMKKDMGGAASVLSLAHIIIQCKLRVNLKVLIPAVNNDIGPSSMRPGDVYNSRFGITVEIGNTDAEGRLILADTLTYADSFKPKLLIDFATLTGAARVALGPDLPAYFTHSEELASLINKISIKEYDPLWRLPLHSPYESWLNSEVADTNNISQGSFAGAIIAALFLNKFVKSSTNWIHIDTYAWSDKNRPGHSKGGDILGVRSIYQLIKEYINSL